MDLVGRLAPSAEGWRALDLGCGNGEFLLRWCSAHGLPGDGVERNVDDVKQAESRAAELDIESRVPFHHTDASAWDRPANLVINVGASHIWGDAPQALAALRRLARPGGKVLFAEWLVLTPA